ncbi:MAG: hypothetical protein AAF701_02430, partial [Pseudomonadota bacterium]
DNISAKHLKQFSEQSISVLPNLKSASPPYRHPDIQRWSGVLRGRAVWAVGSAHWPDIEMAVAAHKQIVQHTPSSVLIILPRDLEDIPRIAPLAQSAGLTITDTPDTPAPIIVEQQYGRSGGWYDLAQTALIGGGFGTIGGHNPWEAAHSNCLILSGPHTAHFQDEYNALHAGQAAIKVYNTCDIVQNVFSVNATAYTQNAQQVLQQRASELTPMFDQIYETILSEYEG